MAQLIDSLQAQLTSGPALSRLRRELGTDEASAQRAVSAALPLLLGGLARNTRDPQGAQSLSGALARDHDGALLDDLPGAVSNYQALSGAGILGHIFGGRRDTVATQVGRATGVDGGKLLMMLAPIVLSMLARQQRQQGLDPGGLAGTLQREQADLDARQPGLLGTLGGLLDADRDGDITDDLGGMLGRFLGGR